MGMNSFSIFKNVEIFSSTFVLISKITKGNPQEQYGDTWIDSKE
jgi:hypothetical protein